MQKFYPFIQNFVDLCLKSTPGFFLISRIRAALWKKYLCSRLSVGFGREWGTRSIGDRLIPPQRGRNAGNVFIWWRHNGLTVTSNEQHMASQMRNNSTACSTKRRVQTKKTSKLRTTGLCEEIPYFYLRPIRNKGFCKYGMYNFQYILIKS